MFTVTRAIRWVTCFRVGSLVLLNWLFPPVSFAHPLGLNPLICVPLGRAHDHYTNMNTGSVTNFLHWMVTLLKGSLNLLVFSSRDSINLIDQLGWHLPTRVQTSGEGGALWRIFWPKGASPRCKSYSDFWITLIVSQKALTSTLLKVVALVLWMLKRSNLHNNCIEMGIK